MPTGKLTLRVFRTSPLDASYGAFILANKAARYTPKTIRHYEYTVGSFVAWLKERGVSEVGQITKPHIREYLVSLQERGLKDTTQHAHARGIKTWCNWLVDEGEIDVSPFYRLKMPKLEERIPPPFTREDIDRLLSACNRRTIWGARDYAILLVLLDTGLRASEFLSLKVGQIDMRSGLCRVMGKGQKEREVRVGAEARSALLRYLGRRGDLPLGAPMWMAYTYVNTALRGDEKGPLTFNGLERICKRVGKRAGVEPCSPHRFRRTFALWMLRDGCDLENLRHLMGHSTLDVLRRYLKLSGVDVERVHLQHSPVDNILRMPSPAEDTSNAPSDRYARLSRRKRR